MGVISDVAAELGASSVELIDAVLEKVKAMLGGLVVMSSRLRST